MATWTICIPFVLILSGLCLIFYLLYRFVSLSCYLLYYTIFQYWYVQYMQLSMSLKVRLVHRHITSQKKAEFLLDKLDSKYNIFTMI